MEQPVTISLVVGLAASLITVFVTKILEIWQFGQKHRHEIQRNYIEKKLQAAENAINKWLPIMSYMGNLAVLYERMGDDKEEFSVNVFQDANEKLSKKLNQLVESNENSYAVMLYFDLNVNELWSFEKSESIFQISSKIQLKATEQNLIVKSLEVEKDNNKRFLITQKIKDNSQEIKGLLISLANILKESNQTILNAFKKLKEEIKEFEGK